MTLESLNLVCTKTQTQPKRAGKLPRDVYVVSGQTQGFEALFRDLGGHFYHGKWSFWDDPTESILSRSDERMSFEKLQSYKVDRKLAKADRYRSYGQNAQARSKSAHSGVTRITDRIPFGQPILVGHHSEKRARADQRRIERGMHRVLKESDKAQYFATQSASLERQAEQSHSLRFIGNRIEEKTAEIAKIKRYLNGQYYSYSTPNPMGVSDEYRLKLQGQLEEAEEALSYWQAKKALLGDRLPSRETIKVGMFVKCWAGSCEVLKVNAKSVTIRDFHDKNQTTPPQSPFTRTIKYHEISSFRACEVKEST